jgi:hypothetical protein
MVLLSVPPFLSCLKHFSVHRHDGVPVHPLTSVFYAVRVVSDKTAWTHGQPDREITCFFFKLKSWVTQNFITIKTSWNTND